MLLLEELRRNWVSFGAEALLADEAGQKIANGTAATEEDKRFQEGFSVYAERKRRMWMAMHEKSRGLHQAAVAREALGQNLPTLKDIVADLSINDK